MNRRIALVLSLLSIALVALVVWIVRPASPDGALAVVPNDAMHAPSATARTAPALDISAIETAPTRTPTALEPDPSALPHRTDLGRILGTVRASADSLIAVTSGFARVDCAPPIPGVPRDAAEEARLFVGFPVRLIDHEGHFEFPRVPFGDWILSIDPEGFEGREQRVTLSSATPEVRVEFMTRRKAGPSTLAIVLQDENGAPFSATPLGADLEIQKALQPLFVDRCLPLGSEFDPWLQQLERAGPDPSPVSDAWAVAAFPEPIAGCACVAFGPRVLDAAPFAAGQAVVVLKVRTQDLPRRRSLELLVVDKDGHAPLANANVLIRPRTGEAREAVTDPSGHARAEGLFVGEVTVIVGLVGYSVQVVGAQVLDAEPAPTTTIELSRAFSLSGTVRFQGQPSGFVTLTVMDVDEDRAMAVETLVIDASLQSAPFRVESLEPLEYFVGVNSGSENPDFQRVRRGEVPGWAWADLRHGPVDGIVLDVTEAMFSAAKWEVIPAMAEIWLAQRRARTGVRGYLR